MTALPAALYADPATVVADAEAGDQVPVEREKPRTCFQCRSVQPAIGQPPCSRHCMPSPRTGRCVRWADAG